MLVPDITCFFSSLKAAFFPFPVCNILKNDNHKEDCQCKEQTEHGKTIQAEFVFAVRFCLWVRNIPIHRYDVWDIVIGYRFFLRCGAEHLRAYVRIAFRI